MNAYPNFNPPCLEKDSNSRDRSHSKSGPGAKTYPAQSNIIQQSRKRYFDAHPSAFTEAVLSPVKYAVFQVLGTCFLQLSPCPLAPKSYALSAKTGAFGGIIVAIFYLLLVVMGNRRLPASSDAEEVDEPKGMRHSSMIVIHEMLYSALASAVGSLAYSRTGVYHVELGIHVFAGSIGPILFLGLLFSLTATAWCSLWMYNKFMDWYAGYL